MNNYGASYIEKGQYDKAIVTLCKVLKKSLTYYYVTTDDDDACMEEDSGFTWCCRHQKKRSTMYHYFCDQVKGEHFVHTSPIFIPETSRVKTCFVSQFCLSAVATCNLAIAHHLNALSKRRRRKPLEDDLRQARTVYGLCHSMLLESEAFMGSGTLFMSMLVANNVGQLYALSGSPEKAQSCFEQLLSLQMFIVDSKEEVDEDTWMNLDGFFHNTSRLILKNEHVVAAAA
jgi:tetratricopeptide (TPR) repeat protein